MLAFHANYEETGCEEADVGEVTHQILDDNGGRAPAYTLHYFDMVVRAGAPDGELPDAGGATTGWHTQTTAVWLGPKMLERGRY